MPGQTGAMMSGGVIGNTRDFDSFIVGSSPAPIVYNVPSNNGLIRKTFNLEMVSSILPGMTCSVGAIGSAADLEM